MIPVSKAPLPRKYAAVTFPVVIIELALRNVVGPLTIMLLAMILPVIFTVLAVRNVVAPVTLILPAVTFVVIVKLPLNTTPSTFCNAVFALPKAALITPKAEFTAL